MSAIHLRHRACTAADTAGAAQLPRRLPWPNLLAMGALLALFMAAAAAQAPTRPLNDARVQGGSSATANAAVETVQRASDNAYFASVADALADAGTQAGDTLELAPGTYSGGIVLTKGVHLVGSTGVTPLAGPVTPPSVVIDGGNTVQDGITIAAGVTGASVSGLEIRNFTRYCVHGVSGNDNLTITESVLHHCADSGVWINGDVDYVTIDHNEVYDFGFGSGAAGRGIVIWNGIKRDITISDNWVHDGVGCCGIELQDGTATGAWITDNVVANVGDSGMGFVQLTSGSPTSRANIISGNQLSNTGRFGIELKIPNGTGAASGDGAIIVENNTVDGAGLKSLRDRAGIAVFRRAFASLPGQVDVTQGVVVQDNTISGFRTSLPGFEGYGIVVEGLGSTVQRNALGSNDIGFQLQQGNPAGTPPGDANQFANNDWFGRGNALFTCASVGELADANTYSANTTDQREIPIGTPMIGSRVLNQDTGARYCSINSAIATAVPGETLVVDPGVFVERVIIDREITLLGAQATTAAGPSRSSDPTDASIIVPPEAASGMSYTMGATRSVMSIFADDVVVDGFVLDGDNPAIATGLPMGSADPDVDTGVFASGSNIRFVNNEVRNLVYGGFLGYNSNSSLPARQGNEIAHNWIHNLDAPSSWGIGVVGMWNYYADIHDNLINDVRIGIQTNYFFKTAPNPGDARIADNTISASVTGIYHNYHTADQTQASPFTLSGNTVSADANPAGSGVWTGIFLQAFYDASSAVVNGNTIDGSALAGSGRLRLGYGISNIVTSIASTLGIDGGSATGVDYGVLATDGAFYAGAVNDYTISNLAFSDVAIAAIAVEDTALAGAEVIDNAVRLTVGAGNTFSPSVAQHGSLSGPNARIEFATGVALLDRMLVEASGQNYRAGLPDSNGNVRMVDAGVINHAIADAAVGGTVTVEAGLFTQNVVVDKAVSLVGPHAGVEGNDGSRGTGEAVLKQTVAGSPGSSCGATAPLRITSASVVVNGLEIDDTTGGCAVRIDAGASAAGIKLLNNRILDFTSTWGSGGGVFVSGSDGVEIAGNLLRNFVSNTGSGYWAMGVKLLSSTNASAHHNTLREVSSVNIQLSSTTNASVHHNDIDATARANVGNAGIQLAATSNSLVRDNTISTMDTGILWTPGNATSSASVCNTISDSTRGIFAMGPPWPGTHTHGPILHNALSANVTDIRSTWDPNMLIVGSNWYGGASATVIGSALVADALPASPIGSALCGNNAAHEIVAYAGTGTQSTPVDTAFSPLRARVQDQLGGAVAGQPVTLAANTSVEGATAALGTASGTTNYNGEVISTATANSIAGSYDVDALSNAMATAFALTNTQGTATVAVSSPTVTYDGSPHAVTVTTTPSGLEDDVQIVYTQGMTTVATCAATDSACGPVNAGVYTATATIVGNPNYTGSGTGTLTIQRAATTIEFLPNAPSFVYDGNAHDGDVSARLAAEPGTSCPVTGAIGPNVGSYSVSAAACTGTNYEAPAAGTTATVTPQPTTISFSHLVQAYDGSPKSVVATTAPTAGVALSITYNGGPTPPTAVGSYSVVATVTDPNFSGSNSATLQIVNGLGDIALVLNGPVDPIHVGDAAQYAATMLANPALHTGELYGYHVVVSKSGGSALALSDIATMEVYYGGAWVDATSLFGSIPFTIDGGGNLVYDFPDGIPGYPGGFPILDASWTWNVRFSFATPGIYTVSTTLTDGIGGPAIVPTVAASIATVVLDALPATDIHLALGGPAESIEVAQVAEYTGTLIADPSLHVGEDFFVKVSISKSGGHPLVPADLATMEMYYGGVWTALPPGVVTQPGGPGTELLYHFPKPAMPGGFEITSPTWTWNFRFGYADVGVYTAVAEVIHAADEGNPLAHVFATAAVATTVVDATPHLPNLGLLLTGPLDDIELGDAAQYTGTLLAEPALYTGQNFWVRIRISKSGGSHALVPTDLAMMELYAGGWQDHTATLQPLLVADGADLVYYFPQPFGAFTIDNAIFSWNFRFTYGATGVYTATADLIDAANPTPLTAPALASASVETTVIDTPLIELDVQGPVVGVVNQALQYAGTLTADPLPNPTDRFFVEVRIQRDGGLADPGDISKAEIFWGGNWVDPVADLGLTIPWTVDGNELVYLFPQPVMPTGFPIDEPTWTWQFRFTYANPGLYTAASTVVTADGSATPVSNTETIQTSVVAQTPGISLVLQGPLSGIGVGEPAHYTGALLVDPLPDPSEQYIVRVRLGKNGGADAMTIADLTSVAFSADGLSWTPRSDVLLEMHPDPLDPDFLIYDFPNPDAASFPITGPWTWHFQFTYASEGTYSAEATVLEYPAETAASNTASIATIVGLGSANIAINPMSLVDTFDGTAHAVTASTTPSGLAYTVTYTGLAPTVYGPSTTPPSGAGSYTVDAVIDAGQGYAGSDSAVLVIHKAQATVTIDPADLHQATPVHAVDATASATSPLPAPTGSITMTYGGSPALPVLPGSYSVVATLVDPNYVGAAAATLQVTDGAAVTVSVDSAPGMALVGLNAPYTDLLDYLGSVGNSGSPTTQAVHVELVVVRIDDGNGSGGLPIAIASDDVLACVHDPAGWAAQEPGNHHGCPMDYASLFVGQTMGAHNGRTATFFRYPNLAANDAVMPTVDPPVALGVKLAFKAGEYQIVGRIVGADGHVYASTTPVSTTVPNALIAYNGPTSGQAEDAILSQTRLTNTGGRSDGNVIVRVTLSDAGGAALVPADAEFAYQLGGGFMPLPWTQVGDDLVTWFGPPAGFAFEDGHDATTSAQAIFHREGSYTVTYDLLDALTHGVLFTSTEVTPVVIGPNMVSFALSDLSQVYDGSPRAVTVTPAAVPHTVVYEAMVGPTCPAVPGGSNTTPPTDAGSYCVYVNATGVYQGSAQGTLVVAKAPATVTLDDDDGTVDGTIHRTYSGSLQVVNAISTPTVGAIQVTYNGDAAPPQDAGTYSVVATVVDPNYSGSASGTLIVAANGGATITLDGAVLNVITRTFDGTPQAVTATTLPAGISYAVTYAGDGGTNYPLSAVPPVNAGQYHVVATTTDPNYAAVSAAGTLVIEPASTGASIALDDDDGTVDGTIHRSYSGGAQAVAATTTPNGLAYAVQYVGIAPTTYGPTAVPPTHAGSYTVTASVTDPNYTGINVTGTLVIEPQSGGVVSFDQTSFVYSGAPQSPQATMTGDSNVSCSYAYTQGGSPLGGAPSDVGSYEVTATCTGSNTTGTGTTVFTIVPASAQVLLSNLVHVYDGTPKAVTVATSPGGLAVDVTYDGNGAAPFAVGEYVVLATVNDPNYVGQASATLRITTAAVTISDIVWADNDQASIGYDASAHAATATVTGSSLTPTFTYNGSSTAPTNAGSYYVVATVDDGNVHGSASAWLTITPIPAGNSGIVVVGGTWVYDGQPHAATVTNPNGVAHTLTYHPGGSNVPQLQGVYTATVLVTDPNYASEVLVAMITILDDPTPCAIFCDGFEDSVSPRADGLVLPGVAQGSADVTGWTIQAGTFGKVEPVLELLDAHGRAIVWMDAARVTDGHFLRLRWLDAQGVEQRGAWVRWNLSDRLEYAWDVVGDGLVLRFGSHGQFPEALALPLPQGSPIPEAARALRATGSR